MIFCRHVQNDVRRVIRRPREAVSTFISSAAPFVVSITAAIVLLLMMPAHASAQAFNSSDCKIKPFSYTSDSESLGGSSAPSHFEGHVDIECDNIRLNADEVNSVPDRKNGSNHITARGNVVFIELGTRVSAERLEFDSKTKTGTFYTASGVLTLIPASGAAGCRAGG